MKKSASLTLFTQQCLMTRIENGKFSIVYNFWNDEVWKFWLKQGVSEDVFTQDLRRTLF